MTKREQELLEKIKNTNPIYLHKDFKVNPGRKGKIMDQAAFSISFEEFCDNKGLSTYEIFYEDYFKKDQKITFDFENVEEVEVGETSSGVPWILFVAGGDWELPIHFFIYPGEKGEPRMYIPISGNVFHKKMKVAFGSLSDKILEIKPDLPFNAIIDEENYHTIEGIIAGSGLSQGYKKGEIENVIAEICKSKSDYYKEIVDSVSYNIDWMKDELESRIIVV